MKRVFRLGFAIFSILFLCAVILIAQLLVSNKASAAPYNWSIDPGSVASGGVSGTGSWGVAGVPNNIRDDNISTSYSASCTALLTGTNLCNYSYTATVTFSQVITINTAEIVHATTLSGNASVGWNVKLNISGTWQTVMSGAALGGLTTSNVSGPWSNVSGIQVAAAGAASANLINPASASAYYVYELRAWGQAPGPAYINIGLRYFDGSSVVPIAAEATGTVTSKLRISKNGITYGIVLVPISDPNASKIDIMTGSGVQALRKYP